MMKSLAWGRSASCNESSKYWRSSGKIHQTIYEQEWSTRLLLNGGEVRLGTVTDVVDKVTGRRTFVVGLLEGNREVRWTFEGADRRDMSATVSSVRAGGADHVAPKALRFL